MFSPIRSDKIAYLLLALYSYVVDLSLGYPLRVSYVIALFFILLTLVDFSEKLYRITILFFTALAAIYFPIGQIFGGPAFNVVAAVFYTDRREAGGLFAIIPTMYYIGSLLILMFGIYLNKLSLNKPLNGANCLKAFVIICILHSPIKVSFAENRSFNLSNIKFTPVRFFVSLWKNISTVKDENIRLKSLLKQQDTWSNVSYNHKYKIHVVVIGESVRKDFMNVYGFPIANTPFSSKANGLFFENYLSASCSTHSSLSASLTESKDGEKKINNNIISLAKKAGFHTYWISNQEACGLGETPVGSIGKSADYSKFITEGRGNKNIPDEELLPFIHFAIEDKVPEKSKLIVVHLIGSHASFCARTRGKYNEYYRSKNLSCYAHSICNTDLLLGEIADSLKKNGDSWSMMYFSDHGLSSQKSLFTKTLLLHSDKYQENFRVPMFIVSSDDRKKEIISAYRSGMSFLNIFSEWTTISANEIANDCCYLSNEECKNQSYVLIGNMKKVDINTLPQDHVK